MMRSGCHCHVVRYGLFECIVLYSSNNDFLFRCIKRTGTCTKREQPHGILSDAMDGDAVCSILKALCGPET